MILMLRLALGRLTWEPLPRALQTHPLQSLSRACSPPQPRYRQPKPSPSLTLKHCRLYHPPTATATILTKPAPTINPPNPHPSRGLA